MKTVNVKQKTRIAFRMNCEIGNNHTGCLVSSFLFHLVFAPLAPAVELIDERSLYQFL
jgi:hypothetical protein